MGGDSKQHARDPPHQRKIESMNRAEDDSPEWRADIVPQQISWQVGQRVKECLEAAWRDIRVEPPVQRGKSAVLMVIAPVPIDIFATEPGVKRARQKRADD